MMGDERVHKDLRSSSVSINRAQKAKQKYFGYRAHHPSTVGQPYVAFDGERRHGQSSLCNTSISGLPLVTLGDETCVRTWTKRDLWLERLFGIYPIRPPHHYGGCRYCHPIKGKGKGPKWEKKGHTGSGPDMRTAPLDIKRSGFFTGCKYNEIDVGRLLPDDPDYDWGVKSKRCAGVSGSVELARSVVPTEEVFTFEMIDQDDGKEPDSDDSWSYVEDPFRS